MNKNMKLICSIGVISIFTGSFAYANEIPQSEYLNNFSWYIDNDKIDKIKVAPVINIKAIDKGMNLGYLDPKVKQINSIREEINELKEKIEATEITNDTLKSLNEELLTRLDTMSTYLERSEKQYKDLIGYDRHYITLKVGDIVTASADDNLKYYNKDFKEVKRIYKDIKEVMKDI